MVTYRELHDRSLSVEKHVCGQLDLSKFVGRYKEYQKLVKELSDAWESDDFDGFMKKHSMANFGFALKELNELTEILEQIANNYSYLSDKSKISLRERVKSILSGPIFTIDENPKNSSARNYQFELRLAAKFFEAGFTDIEFDDNPDLLVTISGRKYAFECKRILGLSEKAIITNILKAIDQLEKKKDDYFAGIVALDVSPQYEQGKKWLKSKSRETANDDAFGTLEKYSFHNYGRVQNLKKAAIESHVVATWMNFSTVYVLDENNELGWLHLHGVLALNAEDKDRAERFVKDFEESMMKYVNP